MPIEPVHASSWLIQEALALLTRLNRVKPFALHMPMVGAATVPPKAWVAMEQHLIKVRRELRSQVYQYLTWLGSSHGRNAAPGEAQRLFSLLRLRFNSVLDQLDIFADVLTQRSEHENGVWLSGLDVAAADALRLPGGYYEPPPVVCYLDRGHGAAIRRARTRLPGGKKNPVAIIRIPRERMVGSGVASSLYHEVGHQGSALLNLVDSVRPAVQLRQRQAGQTRPAWICFERWLSEIIADFWSLAKLGVAATVGLMSVVSLPRWFVFRINMDDPHPFPWVRVKLSCAMGGVLYPDRQWHGLSELWEAYYPKRGLDESSLHVISALEAGIPEFTRLLVNHRPNTLKGGSLRAAFELEGRRPVQLRKHYRTWRSSPAKMHTATPTLVFAVIGQARADGVIRPKEESDTVAAALRRWALHRSWIAPEAYATLPAVHGLAPAT